MQGRKPLLSAPPLKFLIFSLSIVLSIVVLPTLNANATSTLFNYSISYGAGTGTGLMSAQTGTDSTVILTSNTFAPPTGDHFAGWLGSDQQSYSDGQSLALTNDLTLTLTAVWAGPSAALTPTFDTATATANGFNVQITNFDITYTWAGALNVSGNVSISGTGLVSVSGVAPDTAATATITTTRDGYISGSAAVSATSMIGLALVPTFETATATTDGFKVQISNFDSAYSWSGSVVPAATVNIGSAGLVSVTGVAPGTNLSASISTSRIGYNSGSSTISVPNHSYSITYNPDIGTGSSYTETGTASAVVLSHNSFTPPAGKHFSGWLGSDAQSYSDGQSLALNADLTLTLTAQWSPDTYTLTFNPNGATSGSVLAPAVYHDGDIVTIDATNTGVLAHAGQTFFGWRGTNNGSNIFLQDPTLYGSSVSTSFIIHGDVTLSAQFIYDTYLLYDANGGTGSHAPDYITYNWPPGHLTLPHGTGFSKLGYIFAGWSKVKDDPTTVVTTYGVSDITGAPGDNYTVYALWVPIPGGYKFVISYDPGIGTGSIAPQSGSSTLVTLTTNSFTPLTGERFVGWLGSDSNAYTDGQQITLTADLTLILTAQWVPTGVFHTVTFHSNGGTGYLYPQSSGSAASLKNNYDFITKFGYGFAGWNSIPDGSGEYWSDGQVYDFSSDLNLYAVWKVPLDFVTIGPVNNSLCPQYCSSNYSVTLIPYGGQAELFKFFNSLYPGRTCAGCLNQLFLTDGQYDLLVDGNEFLSQHDYKILVQNGMVQIYGETADSNGGVFFLSPDIANFLIQPVDGFNNLVGQNSGSICLVDSSNNCTSQITGSRSWSLGFGTYKLSMQVLGYIPTSYFFNFTNTGAIFTDISPLIDQFGNYLIPVYMPTVSFKGNGGIGSMSPEAFFYSSGSADSLPLTPNSFSRSGYQFDSWNTAPDGTGTIYFDNYSYSFTSDVILYAQWSKLPTYTVSFDSNGGSGTIKSEIESGLQPLTANSFTNGSLYFVGWNTQADGKGTNYFDGDNYEFSMSDAILYAQWNAHVTISFQLIYPGSFITSGANPPAVTFPLGTTYIVPGNTGGLNAKGGTFEGWSAYSSVCSMNFDSSSCHIQNLSPGQSIAVTESLVFNSSWSANAYLFYDGNSSTGGLTPNTQSALDTQTDTVENNTFSKSGFHFVGWSTSPDGTGTAYAIGESLNLTNVSFTLYAQWIPDLGTTFATVTFDSNGGTGTTLPQVNNMSAPLHKNGFIRAGRTFIGWNSQPDGLGSPYADGSNYSFAVNTTL